jgi:hypothetical protein
LSRYEDEPDFIYRIVTEDQTWANHFDPESKKSEHAVPHPSKEIQESAVSMEDDGFNYLG